MKKIFYIVSMFLMMFAIGTLNTNAQTVGVDTYTNFQNALSD